MDELNHLACLLSELTSSELETLEAVLDSGEYTLRVRDIINLTQNLDCFEFYPGVSDEETLGRIYVDDLEMLDVPDQVNYFDYEAYGRDSCIHENGHFAPGGYVLNKSDHFVEVYHGLQDIPKEHKVFSFPKLSIREQMAAYQEIIDGSSLEGYRQMQKKEVGIGDGTSRQFVPGSPCLCGERRSNEAGGFRAARRGASGRKEAV